ncbi:V-type ATPase subunit [Tissierella sp.]|uniref:V-type ATPase subunit n=1 Tax=Tissierella sp. TaxID=41274 RepID=UPI00285CEC97|nr:V-type ATPase subunit [Tissierella sp.]MDR7857392.1 V-type ATPase subunit [Tissierella sp.]
MSGERRFAAINTKIRVLRTKVLEKKDYIILMEKENVEAQIAYLREKTAYQEELSRIEKSDNIQQVEIELKRHLIAESEKIIKYFTDSYRSFFRSLMLRHEIEDLKLFLRMLERKENTDKIQNLSLLKGKYYSFDIKAIKSSSSLEEFIENLRGTIYYDVLNPYKNEEHSKIIFYMEMNLDRLYFSLLKSKSQSLKKEDRIIFEKILGTNVDLLNIEWIYRGIKFYNLLPEELINFALPNGHEFEYKDIKKMCYSNVEELKEIVLKTQYDFLFDTEKDVDLYMERRMQRYLHYKFLDAFKKAKLDIHLSMAYIHLLEYEIRDIISILEAKKYGLTMEETKDYLVMKVEGSDE